VILLAVSVNHTADKFITDIADTGSKFKTNKSLDTNIDKNVHKNSRRVQPKNQSPVLNGFRNKTRSLIKSWIRVSVGKKSHYTGYCSGNHTK